MGPWGREALLYFSGRKRGDQKKGVPIRDEADQGRGRPGKNWTSPRGEML